MALERVMSFGPGKSLVGILCEPPAGQAIEGAPAIITWNVGLNHRVGPYRIYVDLARKLAGQGFTSLRFDVSGLGDSAVDREDTRSDAERAKGDVQAAMNLLREQRGIKHFVLIGFCSSVDAAHALGADIPEVAGVVYLEGYGFRTPGYYLRYPLRFFDRNRWRRRFWMWLPQVLPQLFDSEPLTIEREEIYVRDYPTPRQFADDVRRMLGRGARLLFIYAGGDTTYTYREQLYDMLGDKHGPEGLDLIFQQFADHTFFLSADRKRAVSSVVDWMRQRFGAPAHQDVRAPAPPTNGAAHVTRITAPS
jgi:hypothetical protein